MEFSPFEEDVVDPITEITTDVESPLETVQNSYKPDDDESIVIKISPAKWESLLKIIELLTKDSDNAVIINNSVITHSLNGAILKADLTKAFDNEKIDLHIPNPKNWIRLFKQFKDNRDIFIIDDKEKNIFIVTNGEIRLFLPKQMDTLVNDLNVPSIEETKTVTEINISKEIRDKIINLAKGSEYIEYLIQDSELKAVNIPDTAVYIFMKYVNDPKIKNLNENTADMTLRSSVFLPISAEEYDVLIGRRPDGVYFSYTICKTGYVSIELYETLDDASGQSIFI